jgi:hypothetical protein
MQLLKVSSRAGSEMLESNRRDAQIWIIQNNPHNRRHDS